MVVSKFYINTRIFIKTWFNRIDKISAVSVTLLANGLFHGAHWSLGRPTIFQLGIYGCYLRCFNIIQSNDKSRADYKQILKMFLLNSLLVQFLAKRFWMRVNRMIMTLIFSREREVLLYFINDHLIPMKNVLMCMLWKRWNLVT